MKEQKPPADATVYVVDDDASVRESLCSLIRSAGIKVEDFSSPKTFLAREALHEVACIVLDVRMPEMDGLALHETLKARGVDKPIIFMTGHGDVPLAVRAMKAGAIDFLNKPFSDDDFLNAINGALAKCQIKSTQQKAVNELKRRFETLTLREKQVASEVSQGKSIKCVAIDLGLAEGTVKVHKHNALGKLNIRTMAELALVMQRINGG